MLSLKDPLFRKSEERVFLVPVLERIVPVIFSGNPVKRCNFRLFFASFKKKILIIQDHKTPMG